MDARFAKLPKGPIRIKYCQLKGEALLEIIQKGQSIVDYACKNILSTNPTPQEKGKVTSFLFPALSEMESMVMIDSYWKKSLLL